MSHDVPGGPGRQSPAIPLKTMLVAIVVFAFVPTAWAGGWKGSCDIRFHGTSNLHEFAGSARCRPFQVGVENVAGGETIISGAEVAVPTTGMDTDNKSRDRQMRTMFQSDAFPAIRGVFGRIDPERIRQELRRGPEARAPLDFKLTIRDIERPVHAVVSNFREADRGVSFDVDYDVSLSDYRLIPPKAFFGLVRVDDKVTVKTTVRLEPGGGPK